METDNISTLRGKVLSSVKGDVGDEEIEFVTEEGERYKLLHFQDCCESVQVEEIHGDLQDLVGAEVLYAEEVSSESDVEPKPGEYSESWTWTFYRISTAKGAVTIRWLGESNGYYSEGVDFVKIE